MNFSKGKCQNPHLGKNSCTHQHTQEGNSLESIFAKKGVGVLEDSKLTMSQQCTLTAKDANSLPGWIRSVARSLREVILLLCSVLGRLHLQGWVQLWAPTTRKIQT